jgi:3,4-dihydroxy 2-butanone 4-phosphate synthase / GTP cyclohydrolase II
MSFHSIPEILSEIAAGRMVVILDDEDRENEGDLIMAASKVRPEDVNFMARHARGLICLGLTRERCKRLGIGPMVARNTARMSTNFTVSIEAAEGVTTGISAYDRAHTIRTAVAADAGVDDIVQPGHIFPLMAQPGGVLARAGHTEAAVDLACLAGLEPAGVLVEIMGDDGHMARRPQLEVFAAQHGLKIGSIADLIRYRLATEKTIERVAEQDIVTDAGPFKLRVYRDMLAKELHHALVYGEPNAEQPTLVRVHTKNFWTDVLGIQRGDFGLPLRQAMAQIAAAGSGVIVVIGDRPDNEAQLARLHSNVDGDEHGAPWRMTGIGAQILADLGLRRLRVLGTPRRYVGLAGFGLEVVEYVGGVAAS